MNTTGIVVIAAALVFVTLQMKPKDEPKREEKREENPAEEDKTAKDIALAINTGKGLIEFGLGIAGKFGAFDKKSSGGGYKDSELTDEALAESNPDSWADVDFDA